MDDSDERHTYQIRQFKAVQMLHSMSFVTSRIINSTHRKLERIGETNPGGTKHMRKGLLLKQTLERLEDVHATLTDHFEHSSDHFEMTVKLQRMLQEADIHEKPKRRLRQFHWPQPVSCT